MPLAEKPNKGLAQPAAIDEASPIQFIPHITEDGERWDTPAWKYYGDPTLVNPIIMTNPSIPIMAVFPAGLTVGIPVIEIFGDQSTTDLPPWRR